MIYRKLKVSMVEAKDRFYRVLLLREDMNLKQLAIVLITALGGEFEHLYMFRKGKKSYVDDYSDLGRNSFLMSETFLENMDDGFEFEYDFGDSWIFDCRLYKKPLNIESGDLVILLDGKGQGIWEDHKWLLLRYLSGELDPDLDHEDENEDIYFPWNYEIAKLSDFDEAYDLELEKEFLNQLAEDNLSVYGNTDESGDIRFSSQEDEDDDDWEENLAEETSLNDFISDLVFYQLDNDPYVSDVFKTLKERLGEEKAGEILMSILADEVIELVYSKKISQSDSYRQKVKEVLEFSDEEIPFH